ncbi:MAG: hypothetical protein COA74_07805 [Gammaproteobacteria bacterium]|nr:MAG: hypothetical protein COA74_07805 [Gammaproteobacteria bacterium]
MRASRQFISITIIVSLFFLTGCGSSSSEPPEVAPQPIVTSYSVIGTIIGLGDNSVQVNNSNYDVSTSSFTLDGNSATYGELRLGMVVTIKGTRSTTNSTTNSTETADSVDYEDELEGPVSSIDLAAETFVVLGILVQVDGMTLFEGVTLDTLAVGNIVEVSGFRDSTDNSILATLVELESLSFSPGDEIEVKGTIADLDDVAQTFNIGSQLVDYSQAVIKDIPNDTLADGLSVEVKSDSDLVDDVLIASEIEGKDEEHDGNHGDEVEVEGIVSVYIDATDFEINGHPITTTSNTVYKNGNSDNIQQGVKLEVEGTLNADGILVAEEVEFKMSYDIKISAPISAIDSNEMTVTVLGIVVSINDLTVLKDDLDDVHSGLTFADLNIDDFVEIRASITDDLIMAGKLEREDHQNEVELEGVVDSSSQPDLMILGVNITTNANTQFEDDSDHYLTADTFFAIDLVGVIVEVEGVFDGSVLTASSVEIED